MIIGVPKELHPDELRVALVPVQVPRLKKAGHEVLIETGAGEAAGYPDQEYQEKGAQLVGRGDVFAKSDFLVTLRGGANADEQFVKDAQGLQDGASVIGMLDPYEPHDLFTLYGKKKITAYSLELIPRITRAQSMDVLSSMANLAGYKAALLAADNLKKMFPMMMTAAGTIVPAKAFILGVGVAGLQAIATTKRLGAVVSAYDVRPAVKDQVLSLGAKFVEMELDTADSESSGGYAKAMDEEFYRKQRELLTGVLKETDVVITTAAIPGKKSPVLITEEMVKEMQPGSVVVDLAVERGGNCELSEAGKTVVKHGVTIIGPVNVPAALAYHASQLFSKNLETFFLNLFSKEGDLKSPGEDEIVDTTRILADGGAVHEDRRKILGL
ncbi:Re/Si-specific NAD(P)(+) transhydrogenase subunit alpha [Spirochaeta lutea]|uniref:NAD(P) transhydrogenase subunit alpha part 1 n=1 Tax=Spirochaeta lutea TaxID=1480694 RepID=A0A098QZP6_9SPIO|nr:Re/Si-specific NAD(P)(+) transhydrogenase subunit alpha [Spirochaeta lutea]KGE71962.1 NAD(P) transhydrogenase subunit alpha [Spirochaeta lutea]